MKNAIYLVSIITYKNNLRTTILSLKRWLFYFLKRKISFNLSIRITGAVLMWRIIEILKYFQYSCSVNIAFLMEKFNVIFRTLQRNITFINTMLIKISNCNISRKQDHFVINGDNEIIAINTLLTQFIHISNEYLFVRMSNLFLICVWQKNI